jgi:hypothetical protein
MKPFAPPLRQSIVRMFCLALLFRAIGTYFAERCRTRTATSIPALTMLGGSIPSPCTMLIWNDCI